MTQFFIGQLVKYLPRYIFTLSEKVFAASIRKLSRRKGLKILFPPSPLSRSLLFNLQVLHSTSSLTICLHQCIAKFLPSFITCDNFIRRIKISFYLYSMLFCYFVLLMSLSSFFIKSTRWRSWLRHNTIKRNVAGMIPDEIFQPH
jgi:hypothetical protein